MQFAMSPGNLLFFCSVTASVTAAFGLFSLYKRLARRRQPGTVLPAGDSEEHQPLTVASSLPPFMYNRLVRHSGKGASWTECAVCLGAIQVGAMVKLLPACAHVYHVDCIDLWLSSHSTCPSAGAGSLITQEPAGRVRFSILLFFPCIDHHICKKYLY